MEPQGLGKVTNFGVCTEEGLFEIIFHQFNDNDELRMPICSLLHKEKHNCPETQEQFTQVTPRGTVQPYSCSSAIYALARLPLCLL